MKTTTSKKHSRLPDIPVKVGCEVTNVHFCQRDRSTKPMLSFFCLAAQAYEKGIALFRWPNVYDIWNTYLTKFIDRYVSTQACLCSQNRHGKSSMELKFVMNASLSSAARF